MRRLNIICTHLSILINSLIGGEYNQSLCCRNYIWYLKGYPNLVKILDRFTEKDHCYEAYIYWKKINAAKDHVSRMVRGQENDVL